MKLGVSVLAGVGLAIFLSLFFRPPGVEVNAQVAADPVFVGAGDIARCNGSGDEATANLLDGIPGTVFTTGDNAYEDGTTANFNECYNPSWGRHKARTMPTPGNHEYRTANALRLLRILRRGGRRSL